MNTTKNSTYTLTFGDVAENHYGMQKIGKIASKGFTLTDLLHYRSKFIKEGLETELYDLGGLLNINQYKSILAYVLVIRNAIKNADELWDEQTKLEKDTKALMKGRVVNKKARYNLCFGIENQEPDYENGKGRIIALDEVYETKVLMEYIKTFGNKTQDLVVEGNYYYDINKCYIGYHGDTERRKVIGVRLGATFPLHFQWYERSSEIGKRLQLDLNHGDMYIMSEKATGFDWHKKIIPTLRHAAGTYSLKLNDDVTYGENLLIRSNKNGYVDVKF